MATTPPATQATTQQNNKTHDLALYTLLIASILSCLPLWLVDYLPSIDLPQHAGQVAILLNYFDESTNYQDIFRLNFFTPYLFGYGVLYLFGLVMDLSNAAKLILSISFVATIFLSRELLQQYGSDKNLAWLVIPVNYGFAFYWGFFTFIVSIPIFLLFLLAVHRYLKKPTIKQGIILGIGSVALFFCHFILFGIAMLIAGLQTYHQFGFRQYTFYLPYFTATPIVIPWFAKTMSSEEGATSTVWNLGIYRIPQLFSYLIGMEEQIPYVLLGIGLIIFPFLLRGRLTKIKWKWTPFAILVLLFFLTPMLLANTLFVYERLAILLFISYLLLFEFETKLDLVKISSIAVYAFLLLTMVSVKFIAFHQENKGFKDMISSIPKNKRVLSLIFKTKSTEFTNHPIYLNFPSWYQVDRGGIVDFNFAHLYPQIVRYRDDQKPKVGYGFGTKAYLFDWNVHEGDIYDYFIVRSDKNVLRPLFREHANKVNLLKKVGAWQLYKNVNKLN